MNASSEVSQPWLMRPSDSGNQRASASNSAATPAPRGEVAALFDYMEAALEAAGFYPPNKKPTMTRNMRDMFHRMGMSEQDVRTWRGAIRALAEGRIRKA